MTNAGNVIYRPVHEISDARWKDTGEHLSQTVGLGTDEKVLAVFAFDQLDGAGSFVLGSSDGYIKQTALSDLQPQRTYKSKPMMAMKLKDPAAIVTNAYFTTDQQQDVFVVSRHAYGLTFPLSDVSTVGARATGVKSMDLKPDDEVVNFILVKDPTTAKVGILTQRGAFKDGLKARSGK